MRYGTPTHRDMERHAVETPEDYFAWVENDLTGELVGVFRLEDDAPLNPFYYASLWAEGNDLSTNDKTGYIPSGCGDYSVTIGYAEQYQSGTCWTTESFFFDPLD